MNCCRFGSSPALHLPNRNGAECALSSLLMECGSLFCRRFVGPHVPWRRKRGKLALTITIYGCTYNLFWANFLFGFPLSCPLQDADPLLLHVLLNIHSSFLISSPSCTFMITSREKRAEVTGGPSYPLLHLSALGMTCFFVGLPSLHARITRTCVIGPLKNCRALFD